MTRYAAFEIALTDEELQMLGEISAIIGQIDYLMLRSVEQMLGVSDVVASAIMGSSRVADNANIWASLRKEKMGGEPPTLRAVEIAVELLRALTADRNDFLHALYGYGIVGAQLTSLGTVGHLRSLQPDGNRIAVRVRTKKRRSVAEIIRVRNRAAELSCVIACACERNIATPRAKELLSRLPRELRSRLGTGPRS